MRWYEVEVVRQCPESVLRRVKAANAQAAQDKAVSDVARCPDNQHWNVQHAAGVEYTASSVLVDDWNKPGKINDDR